MYGNPIEDNEDYEYEFENEFDRAVDQAREYENAFDYTRDKDGNLLRYTVKDSGSQAEYEDGMRRDTTEGKPRFDLIWPEDVPYDEQLLTRVAMQYYRGGLKYGDRNWEKSSTEKSLAHHVSALLRHTFKFIAGVEDGEDHAAAIVWNVNAVLVTRRNIKKVKVREVGDRAQAIREQVYPRVHSFETADRPEVTYRRYNPSTGKYEDEVASKLEHGSVWIDQETGQHRTYNMYTGEWE